MPVYLLKSSQTVQHAAAEYSDETVLNGMSRCKLYAKSRKAMQDAVGDRSGDASYLLGSRSGYTYARTKISGDGVS